ncbi:MAG: GGDEF domain-containing protein [Alphaproteobacteria bacterium]|nr:GGDEF domain-containing protein [Alphaproteobacteria bacterium]
MAHVNYAKGTGRQPDLGVNIGLLVDRFLQAARHKGLMVSDDDRDTLSHLLAAAADAEGLLTAQARRIALLETLSLTDELTTLMNRRGFEREMRRLLANAKRYDERGVMAVIDLDDFKSINDVYGHAAGDAVLASFGRALAAMVRQTDLVARLGGDEFALVLARTDVTGAMARIAQIEQSLDGLIVPYTSHRIPVACSIGTVKFDGLDDFEHLLQRVDNAMYANKRKRKAARG